MPASKNEFLQKLVDTPFIDFDSCYKCHSNNGPFVWCIKTMRGKKITYFLCEECYEKEKKRG